MQHSEHCFFIMRSHLSSALILYTDIVIKLHRSEQPSVGWALIRLNLKDSTTFGSRLLSSLSRGFWKKQLIKLMIIVISSDSLESSDSCSGDWEVIVHILATAVTVIVLINRRICSDAFMIFHQFTVVTEVLETDKNLINMKYICPNTEDTVTQWHLVLGETPQTVWDIDLVTPLHHLPSHLGNLTPSLVSTSNLA